VELLKAQEVASVALFDLRLSEGELEVYEGCIEYVLRVCSESDIRSLTGCDTRAELAVYREDLISLIKAHVSKRFLPDKYKD
jgi:hypothetical protein